MKVTLATFGPAGAASCSRPGCLEPSAAPRPAQPYEMAGTMSHARGTPRVQRGETPSAYPRWMARASPPPGLLSSFLACMLLSGCDGVSTDQEHREADAIDVALAADQFLVPSGKLQPESGVSLSVEGSTLVAHVPPEEWFATGARHGQEHAPSKLGPTGFAVAELSPSFYPSVVSFALTCGSCTPVTTYEYEFCVRTEEGIPPQILSREKCTELNESLVPDLPGPPTELLPEHLQGVIFRPKQIQETQKGEDEQ